MFESIIYGLTVGFVISFVVSVIYQLLKGVTHKLCPACRGSIPKDATKCFHCGEAIELAVATDASHPPGDTGKSIGGIWIFLGAVTVFMLLITAVLSWLLP